MSRVPAQVQFTRYQQLREVWVAQQGAFSHLDWRSQWDIHRFYQPSRDHLPNSLAVHQRTAAEHDPSLPHRAGKAYKELMHAAAALAHARAQPRVSLQHGHLKGPKRQRTITARAVVRPEPDYDKLARGLLDLARQMAAGERSESERQR